VGTTRTAKKEKAKLKGRKKKPQKLEAAPAKNEKGKKKGWVRGREKEGYAFGQKTG